MLVIPRHVGEALVIDNVYLLTVERIIGPDRAQCRWGKRGEQQGIVVVSSEPQFLLPSVKVLCVSAAPGQARARLGINAPFEVAVDREEVWEAIKKENRRILAESEIWSPHDYAAGQIYRRKSWGRLLSLLPDINPKNIIDYGCGVGDFTRDLRTRWPNSHVLGIDRSERMIALARATNWQHGVEHRVGAIESDSLPEAIIDLATIHSVLHSVQDPSL